MSSPMAKITDKLNAASLAASKTGSAVEKAQNAMDLAAADAGRYQSKIEQISAAMDKNAVLIEKLSAKQDTAYTDERQSQIEKLTAKQDKLNDAYQNTERSLAKANASYEEHKNKIATLNDQYDVQSDKVKRLQAEYDELSGNTESADSSTEGFSKRLEKAGGAAGKADSAVEKLDKKIRELSGSQDAYEWNKAMSKSEYRLAKLKDAVSGVAQKVKQISNPFSGWLSKAAGVYSTLRLISRLGRMIGGAFNSIMDATGKWKASTDGTATVMNKFNQSVERTQKSIGENLLPLAAIGADLVAQAFDWLGQKANEAISWVLDNIDKVVMALTIVGSGIVLLATIWAIHWAIMNLPLILVIGVIAALASKMVEMGVTVTDVLSVAGSAFGALYGIIYNGFVWLWNHVIAPFAESLATAWDNPLEATVRIFTDVFDAILSIIESAARAIGNLLGKDWGGAIGGFRADLQAAVETKFGAEAISVERMAYRDIGETMSEFSDKFASIGDTLGGISDKLGNFDLSKYSTGKALDTNVKNVVDINTEDIQMLLDIATRDFQVHYQTLTPTIAVNIDTIRESADVNQIIEIIADEVQDMASSNLAYSF